ncbi:hypothetical protein [Pedosphaera parvula]|uniref:Uncharacterized protein n=1 Tax=Pedosphaera parvula (strain Ellin514) TaxID=320771 RepID=B9XPB9_PEDPL|nr:hypothetical protein [Pedosphaera parvula]EEF58259.1 hypothetical protein Cflav_PD0987 [Pedosphaera parvula Ellin514]
MSLNPGIDALAESGPPSPGDTNNPPTQNSLTNSYSGIVYGTNDFWLEILPYGTNSITQDTNSIALKLHGTTSDIAYQILSKQTLTDAVWTVEQNLLGAVDQNWTPATVSMTNRPTLFLKALAYTLDTDGDGLPDWWEIQYGLDPNNPDTGNTGTPDGYKQDTAGDGWTNLQKYQMASLPTCSRCLRPHKA